MGGMVSYMLSWVIPGKSYDTTPDPGTGLSELDRHIITSTWALVSDKKVIKQNSLDFFLHLYKEYPYMQDYFTDFKGLTENQLRKNPKMKAHALTVMYAINNYVENLDDGETLVGLVQKIAEAHVPRNISEREFKDLEKCFISYLRKLFGDQLTPDIISAWSKLLSAQTSIVIKAQKEYDEKS